MSWQQVLKSAARRGILGATGAATGRHVVLLPAESAADERQFEASAPYRLYSADLQIALKDTRKGDLSVELFSYEGFSPTRLHFRRDGLRYESPSELRFSLESGELAIDGVFDDRVSLPLPTRRFAFKFTLRTDGGTAIRMTSHYIGISTADDDGRYYQGDDYVDYESQSVGEHATILSMLEAAGAQGPVLDIGCATGGLIAKLTAAGYEVLGIEQSQWAVQAAIARLGDGKTFQCNAETDEWPLAVSDAAPFGAIVMWAVYEHFRDPPSILARISALARPGTVLLINTTNAGSFSRQVFGRDWEGYYDSTHHGVDAITGASRTDALRRNGWEIESLRPHTFWHAGADPDYALFRNLETNDSRFRQLLQSRQLGDFIVCAARKL